MFTGWNRSRGSYWSLRRYPEVRAAYDRALAIDPNNVQLRTYRADLDIAWKADTQRVHQVIESLRENNPRAIHQMADSWVDCALADRDPTAAKAALIAAGENTPFNDNAVHFSRSFVEGWIARLEKDEPKARAAFESARAEQEKIVQAQPDYAPPLCVLGVIDAALGRKARGTERMSPRGRASAGAERCIQWAADDSMVCDQRGVGWRERSRLEQLATAAHIPGSVSYGS